MSKDHMICKICKGGMLPKLGCQSSQGAPGVLASPELKDPGLNAETWLSCAMPGRALRRLLHIKLAGGGRQ